MDNVQLGSELAAIHTSATRLGIGDAGIANILEAVIAEARPELPKAGRSIFVEGVLTQIRTKPGRAA